VREAICDTSPIQYLHQIGFLHLQILVSIGGNTSQNGVTVSVR
jgi:hypothetical protein